MNSGKWRKRLEFFFVLTKLLSISYFLLFVLLFSLFIFLKLENRAFNLTTLNSYIIQSYFQQLAIQSNTVILGVLDLASVLLLLLAMLGFYGIRIYDRDPFLGFVVLMVHTLSSIALAMLLFFIVPSLLVLVLIVLLLGEVLCLIKSYQESARDKD